MRIGINARLLLQDKLEGIGWHAWELISRLIKLRSEDTFYLFYDRKAGILIPEGKNVIPVILWPATRHPILLHFWTDFVLSKALIQNHINLFYSPEPIMPKLSNLLSIITIHDISPITFPKGMSRADIFYYRKILIRNTRHASKVITVSNFSKSEILKFKLCTNDNIEVISNGVRSVFVQVSVDKKQITKNKYTGGKPYFISIGSINARKNIDTIIKVFNEYKSTTKNDYLLLLIGKKMGDTRMIDLAYQSSPYKKDILFLGYQPEEKIATLLASADLLINLSAYEGFGMQLVEAMKCGVPLLVSDRSCYPEIVGEAGKSVPIENIKNLVTALNQTLVHRDHFVQRGFTRALAFDWDDSARKLNNLVEKLIKQ